MSPLNLLHASDLHISVTESSRSGTDVLRDLLEADPDSLKAKLDLIKAWKKIRSLTSHNRQILEDFAEFAYKNGKRFEGETVKSGCIDAVLLTGDLATTGDEDDIKMARDFLRARARRKPAHIAEETGDPTLSALEIPVGVLPGNHDRLEKTTWKLRVRELGKLLKFHKIYLPGGGFFDVHIAEKSFTENPVQRMKKLTMPLSGGRTLAVHILLADLTLETYGHHEGNWFGWIGQGRAYEDRCKMLVDETEALTRESEAAGEVPFVIWAVHFPPQFPGAPKSCILVEEGNLISAARRSPVRAIVAGHTHEHLTYRTPGMNFDVFCCGTTTQHEPLTRPGKRYADELHMGNLAQIITIEERPDGEIAISARPLKYVDRRSSDGLKDLAIDKDVCQGIDRRDSPWKLV